MKIQPYLCFEGRCEEAMEFYKSALGAQVTFVMRGSETPGDNNCTHADKIAHAALQLGGIELLMSDGMCSGKAEFKGITLSLALPTDEAVEKAFAALSAGGQVLMAPHQTFFASKWGVCTDPFGVQWMVLSPVPVPA